jgi:hypothetical protein
MNPSDEPSLNPSILPSDDPTILFSLLPSLEPTILPSDEPSVKVFTKQELVKFALSGTCNVTDGLLAIVEGNLVIIYKNATSVEVTSFKQICGSALSRAAGDRIEFTFVVTFESTEPDTFISPEEIIDILEQNSASFATDIFNETGDQVSVIDVRVIEFPSASPSLSPAPTLSQQPTLSIKPSYEFFPSSIPTQSSFPTSSPTQSSFPTSSPSQSIRPTSTPTKAEDRTFNIVSSFKFDDSIRQWCLQAKNVRVNAKFNMRPCTGRSKQKFFFDKFDQLRLRDNPTFCMRWRKRTIFLGNCEVGIETDNSTFKFDNDKQSFIVQKRRFKYLLGVGNGNLKKYEQVRLFKEGSSFSNDSVRLWSLQSILDTPVPSSAPSISFAPTKSSKSSKGKSSKSSKGKSSKSSKGKSPKGQGKGKGKETKTGSPTKSSKTSKDVEDGRKPDVPNDFVAATVSSSTSLHPILASIIALVGMIFVL